MEFGQTTASWNRELGQNISTGHGIERNQTLAGVREPDLGKPRVSWCYKRLIETTHNTRARGSVLTGYCRRAVAPDRSGALSSEHEGWFTCRSIGL